MLVCTSEYGEMRPGRVVSVKEVKGALDRYDVRMEDGEKKDLTMEDLGRVFLTTGDLVEVLDGEKWVQATLGEPAEKNAWKIRWGDDREDSSSVDELKIRPVYYDCDALENPTCRHMERTGKVNRSCLRWWDQLPVRHALRSGLVKIDLSVLNSEAFTKYWECILKYIMLPVCHARPVSWIGGGDVRQFLEARGVTFEPLAQASGGNDPRVTIASRDGQNLGVSVILQHPSTGCRNVLTAQKFANMVYLWLAASRNPSNVHAGVNAEVQKELENVQSMHALLLKEGHDVQALLKKYASLLHLPYNDFVAARVALDGTLVMQIPQQFRTLKLDQHQKLDICIALSKVDLQTVKFNWTSVVPRLVDLDIKSPADLHLVVKSCIRCAKYGTSIDRILLDLAQAKVPMELWKIVMSKPKHVSRIPLLGTVNDRLMTMSYSPGQIATLFLNALPLATSGGMMSAVTDLDRRGYQRQQITTILGGAASLANNGKLTKVLDLLEGKDYPQEKITTILSGAASLANNGMLTKVLDLLEGKDYPQEQITTILGGAASLANNGNLTKVLDLFEGKGYPQEKITTILGGKASAPLANRGKLAQTVKVFEDRGFLPQHITTMLSTSCTWLLAHDNLDQVLRHLCSQPNQGSPPLVIRHRITTMIANAATKADAQKLVTDALALETTICESVVAPTPLQETTHQDKAVALPAPPLLPMLAFGPHPPPPTPNAVVGYICMYGRTRTHSHVHSRA